MENWTVKSVDGEEIKSTQEQEQAVVEEATADNDNIQIESSDDVVKVDLDNPPVAEEKTEQEDAVQQVQGEAEESVLRDEGVEDSSEAEAQDQSEAQEEEAPLELIVDEPVAEVEEKVETPVIDEVLEQPPVQAPELPEGIQKLMNFMEETGGDLNDYVNLNKSYDDMSDVDVIAEYYRQSKPHLDESEIQFLMEDKFYFDKEADDPREIKKKQLAFKEELYDAKKKLNANKEKYYSDLKLGAKLPQEAQEAVSFYQEYKKSQEENQKLSSEFSNKTDQFFNNEFKGFDFKVGENKYRFKVNEVAKTKEYQSDLNNFISEFVGESGTIEDVAGYHKALFAAKNADKIAQHFYEQGRADAIKQSAKESKNIDMSPKGDAASVVRTKTGTQFKVVSGTSSNGLKFKMRK